MKHTLVTGDPLNRQPGDTLVQQITLPEGKHHRPPGYDGRNCGWRVTNVYGPSNAARCEWARVVLGYEVEGWCE